MNDPKTIDPLCYPDAFAYPTAEAYEAAVKALWKHRDEVLRLQEKLREVFDLGEALACEKKTCEIGMRLQKIANG